MAGVRSQLNDFEIEEFFRSLQTLLSSSFDNNISYDSAEYLSRRLDVYERNINILLTRLSESYPLEQKDELSNVCKERKNSSISKSLSWLLTPAILLIYVHRLTSVS